MSGRDPRGNPPSHGGGQRSDRASDRASDRGTGRGRGDGGRGRGDGGRGYARGAQEGGARAGGGRGGGRGRGQGAVEVFQIQGGSVPTPDRTVAQLESSLVPRRKRQDIPDVSTLSLSQRVPDRPGYGTRGAPVVLWTNYFRLMPEPDLKLYRYHIDVSPAVTGQKLHRVVQLLLAESLLSSIASSIATDFRSTLICARRLSSAQTDIGVTYSEADEPSERADGASQRAPDHYRVKLSETGSFAVRDLIDYLTGTSAANAFNDEHSVTQALNIILGHHPKARPINTRVSTRSNVHFIVDSLKAESFDLTGGLQAWRGYFTSVRAATGRLLVNVQVKHAAMYKKCRLDALMEEFLRENNRDLMRLQSFLNKVRVQRLHLRPKSKPTAIEGLASPQDGRGLQNPPRIQRFGADSKNIQFFLGTDPPKPKSGPPLQPNQYITVDKFFSKVYGIQSKAGLPAVRIGSRESPGYLPPEACEVLPAQTAKTKLSPSQTAQMIRFAVRKPFQNARSITENGLADVGLNSSNPILNAFGLVIQSQMLTVQGRILPPPTLRFDKNKTAQARFGGWNMGQLAFSRGAQLEKWSVLWLTSETHPDPWGNNRPGLVNTLRQFHQILTTSGVKAAPPVFPLEIVPIDGDIDNELAIEKGFKNIVETRREVKLLLVILPRQDDSLYQLIKQNGDIKFGIHTVCVIAFKFAKERNDQYFANVSLKFNLKMGGANQSLAPQNLGFIETGRTMVVGIDVTHPSPGSLTSAPSVAAMVASIDKGLSQFPGTLRVQESRKEMVTDLSHMLKSRLVLWRQHNNQQLPDNILIYRDGVSEGQYGQVIDVELPLLQQACRETYPPTAKAAAQKPAISIIIAGKRHHTRFYPTTTDSDKIDEKSANPKNGTVVDRGITESRYWDFFLQAHTAIQGTARPCHYFVVHDEIFANMRLPQGFQHAGDVLEDITHNLCYMFGRATRAVSLCPPAYYADLLCERARQYLSSLFSPGASQAGSVTSGSGTQDATSNIRVHDNVKDSMFYI